MGAGLGKAGPAVLGRVAGHGGARANKTEKYTYTGARPGTKSKRGNAQKQFYGFQTKGNV